MHYNYISQVFHFERVHNRYLLSKEIMFPFGIDSTLQTRENNTKEAESI
jgi:hypothetical protein